MKKIIYTRPDGGVSVVHPAINTHTLVDGSPAPIQEDITEEEALARALAALPADAINPLVVDEISIPEDRTFRDAWTQNGASVSCDMPKARRIHRDRLRGMRARKFDEADATFNKTLEAWLSRQSLPPELSQAMQLRQQLRDATKFTAIDSATTPEELKAAIPPSVK